jgi:predicted MFS family arabinose efflux permease
LRLLTAVFIAALALQYSAVGFTVLYLSMFFWNGMASPPEATALNRILPADKRASMLSAVSLSVQLGGFAGALGFGFIVGKFGITAAWMTAAGILAVSAVLFLFVGSSKLVAPGSGKLL